MGAAYALNELIQMEDPNRIAFLAALSKHCKQIEVTFKKYGRLYDKLRGQPTLIAMLQIKGI